jgi:hypothetical protein
MENCVKNIVAFRDHCSEDTDVLIIDNIIDVGGTLLSDLANENELNGKTYGNNLIEAATESVIADLFNSSGDLIFSHAIEQMHLDGNFGNLPLQNAGILIRNTANTSYGKISIPIIKLKPLFSGNFTLIINGIEYIFVAENGIQKDYEVNYETTDKTVEISIKETDLQFAKLQKTKTTCSGCNSKKFKLVSQTLVNVVAKKDQSNMLPIAYLFCDSSEVICLILRNNMIKKSFARLVAIQVGIMLYDRFMLSNRFNDTTINVNREAVQTYLNTLIGRYRELMFGVGNKTTISFANSVKNSLKQTKDDCINCNATISVATAIF